MAARLIPRLGALLALLLPLAACAVDRALVVGVNAYPQLPRRLWLGGAVNDALAVRDWLQAQRWPAGEVRLLTSPAQAGQPVAQLAAIRGAMQEMLQLARRGDRVFFFLAGHGAQQPNPAEADGLDEVFLPADAAGWSGQGTQRVANGLVDDEIGDWLDALVDRGVQVFAAFDTCHALGMSRAGAGRGVRAVAGADLGLGPARPAPSRVPIAPTRTDGRWLAFAAPSGGATDEAWLPTDVPMARRHLRGFFTVQLTQAWQPGMTAAQASAAMRTGYTRAGRSATLPVLVGDQGLRW